jgi:hypothetical protein
MLRRLLQVSLYRFTSGNAPLRWVALQGYIRMLTCSVECMLSSAVDTSKCHLTTGSSDNR